VKPDLQREFSLHQTLSLYLLDTLPLLDPQSPGYALSLMSLVEAILENPQVILMRQEDKLKGDKLLELKAAGVEYEERIAELEKMSYPKPNADFIYATFDQFRASRPWVAAENVRPKSIARDMFESYASFNDYVREYGLQRSEGLLLRYVSEAYKALLQIVPESYRNDEVLELLAYLRTLLAHVDTSLIEEWEAMLAAAEQGEEAVDGRPARTDISRDPKAFRARIRAEVHTLVKALAQKSFEDAVAAVWQPGEGMEDERAWSEERFAQALAPYFAEYERVLFNERARFSEMTIVKPLGERRFSVVQRLADPKEEDVWAIEAEIDLSEPAAQDGPLLRLVRIGP
jgi:hypothetical protein